MQTRMWFVIILLLAAWSAGAIQAQITSNPIPAPIVKRGLAVEIKDLVRLPDTRGIRSRIRTCLPRAGRASAMCAIFPMAAASPTIRAAFST